MTSASPAAPHHIAIRLFGRPAPQMLSRPKIVLLKIGERIGDFVIALESFQLLRIAFAQAEITLICQPSIVAFAQSTGLFDKVVGFSYVHDVMKEVHVPRMDPADQIAAFKEILDGPYFLAADFRHDGSTRPWLDHIDAYYRAGFAGPTQRGLDIALPAMEWDVPAAALATSAVPLHTELRLTLLAHAIIKTIAPTQPNQRLFPSVPASGETPVYQMLKQESRLKIGVCVGAGSELRQWPSSYWAQLLQNLSRRHDAVFVFFGGQEDKVQTQTLIDALPADRCCDLTGAVSLAEVPAYMGLLGCYFGCDTGLTHLAANLGIPIVNIFAGISNVSVWRAQGPQVKTVYAETMCAPCHLRLKSECPNKNICMTAIVPEIVYACFEQLIASD